MFEFWFIHQISCKLRSCTEGDQSPLLRPGCHRQLISSFMQCVTGQQSHALQMFEIASDFLIISWQMSSMYQQKHSKSATVFVEKMKEVEGFGKGRCFLFSDVSGSCLWATLCHWWHVGQDLCLGQGITADCRRGDPKNRGYWICGAPNACKPRESHRIADECWNLKQ